MHSVEGESGMTLYAVRKRSGQWSVCSDENVVLHFETYDEAIDVARTAAEVLKANRERRISASSPVQRQSCGVDA